MRKFAIAAAVAGAMMAAILAGGGGFSCATTLNSGESVSSALSSVSAGDTVCLNAGTYSFDATVSKTSDTTVRPANGVARSSVTLSSVSTGSSQHLVFKDVTIGSANVGVSGTSPRWITFDGIDFTSGLRITMNDTRKDVTVENSIFDHLSAFYQEGRLTLEGNHNWTGFDNGIVISHNQFGPGGCGDGIQIFGGVAGVTIDRNEFTSIKQVNPDTSSNCEPLHVDALQLYGIIGGTISNNWFHNDTFAVQSPDGDDDVTLTGNLFNCDGNAGIADAYVSIGGGTDWVIGHNTWWGGDSDCGPRIGYINTSGGFSTNMTVRDNISNNGIVNVDNSGTGNQSFSTFTIDHNLIPSGQQQAGVGTGSIVGSPTFSGSVTTWLGAALTAESLGKEDASDSTDIGANPSGTVGPQ